MSFHCLRLVAGGTEMVHKFKDGFRQPLLGYGGTIIELER